MKPINKIGLVAANGTLPAPEILASLLSLGPFVLAADGGANKLLERGIIADAVLGDFDSVSKDLPDSIIRVSAPDQNHTDLDKAVRYLVDAGCESIWIVGATGNRLDHTYGALSTLLKFGKEVDIALVDDIGTARPVDGTVEISTEPGQMISLLALGEAKNITTTGLLWNLSDESLASGGREGISNQAVSEEVTVSVGAGSLIVYAFHLK